MKLKKLTFKDANQWNEYQRSVFYLVTGKIIIRDSNEEANYLDGCMHCEFSYATFGSYYHRGEKKNMRLWHLKTKLFAFADVNQ